MRSHLLVFVVLVASLLGVGFSAVSTYDSVAHLDRQVHGIHCSYFLGAGPVDLSGSSGCYATLMSSYSSILRGSVWGGVPIALLAISVFGFLCFFSAFMLTQRRTDDIRAQGFLFAASGLPFLSSLVMAYISIAYLDAICEMCIGIYIASTLAFVAAVWLLRSSTKNRESGHSAADDVSRSTMLPLSWSSLFNLFGLGVLAVVIPFVVYVALAPDFSHYIGNCGSLSEPDDLQRVLIPYGEQGQDIEMIEVIDPLCAA